MELSLANWSGITGSQEEELREVGGMELKRLADLLRKYNAIGDEIAGVIGRPAERGHVGEYIAEHVFHIALEPSARKRALKVIALSQTSKH